MSGRSLIVNSLWSGANVRAAWRFRRALVYPAHVQERILSCYLRDNADTEYGRLHGFHRIRSMAEYQATVPLTTYDDYAGFVDRIADGEQAVLTRAPVTRLLPSSGSTAAAKLIPYTSTLQGEFNRAIAPWVFDLYSSRPGLLAGTAYWSITPAGRTPTRARSALPTDFEQDSAYLGGFLQHLVAAVMAVPADLRHVQDIEAFRYVTLLFLLRASDLRLISVWHPSFLMLLLAAMEIHWEKLVEDVHYGGLRPPGALPEGVMKRLRSLLPPRATRAGQLRGLGPTLPTCIWPKLALISCWGDGHARYHLGEVERAFPGIPIQPKGLIATEAFVTLPLAGWTPLAVRSHFFEFLDDSGNALPAHEIVREQSYRVVVTTGGGLYRYQLNDRVVVVGFLGRTPCLRFVAKEDHVSDLCGEKLSEGFVANTLDRLFQHANVAPAFAILAPTAAAGATWYTLFIEPAGHASDHLARNLEVALRENPHYAYCVELGQLSPVRVVGVTRGYEKYAERCRSRGRRLGDIKPSPLSAVTGWEEVFAKGRQRD